MNETRSTVILTGLAIVVIAALVGYGLGTLVEMRFAPEKRPGTSPSPLSTPAATPTPAPTVAPQVPAAAPTGPDADSPEAFRVEFTPLPDVGESDLPLVVRWSVHGPADIAGRATTRLLLLPDAGAQVAGAAARVTTLPAAFEATVHLPERGSVLLIAEAAADGTTVRAEERVAVR